MTLTNLTLSVHISETNRSHAPLAHVNLGLLFVRLAQGGVLNVDVPFGSRDLDGVLGCVDDDSAALSPAYPGVLCNPRGLSRQEFPWRQISHLECDGAFC